MTLNFSIQFIRVSSILDARNGIKSSIKTRRKRCAMKKKYYDNTESRKEYKKVKYQKNLELKRGKKQEVEKFNQQIRQTPYYIWVIYHRCLYQHTVKIFYD